MKFSISKYNKSGSPSLKSLRPPLFDINLFWYSFLLFSLVILVITALIGFKLFYFQYFESYKKEESAQNFENIINVNKLKSSIDKRDEFINQQITLPRDPSS